MRDNRFYIATIILIAAVFSLIIASMLLYNPIRFSIYRNRLESEDKKVVEGAKHSILKAGRKSIPHLKAWLKDREIVPEVCQIIMAIEGDYWKEALPELEELLDTYPDEYSLFSAEIVTEKGRYDDTMYEKHPLRQICLMDYKYRKTEDIDEAEEILKKINRVEHPASATPLVRTLENDFHADLKERAIKLLGLRKEPRHKDRLIGILKENENADLRDAAVYALSRYGDDETIADVFINVLENDGDKEVRQDAAIYLGIYKSSRDKIISFLSNYIGREQYEYARSSIYITLGRMCNKKAVSLLISRLEKEQEDDCIYTIFSMLLFDGNENLLMPLLEKSRDSENIYIKMLLAWNFGGKYLDKDLYKDSNDPRKWFMMLACARWGDVYCLRVAFSSQSSLEFSRYHQKLLLMLPEDIKARISDIDDLIGLTIQYPMLRKWYKDNRHRLVWNADSKKYEYSK